MAVNSILASQLRSSRLKLATQAKRAATRRPKKMLHPNSIALTYQRQLVAYVGQWRELYLKTIDKRLEALAAEAYAMRPTDGPGVRSDAWPDKLRAMVLDQLTPGIKEVVKDIDTLALDVGQKTSQWNNSQWRRTMTSIMGVDIYTQEPWLVDQLKSFSNQNVALINKLSDETSADIERIISDGLQSGRRVENIRRDILSNTDISPGRFKKTATRAKLIARDQVAKLNGQLTQLRQQEIGVSTYYWRTSLDERVRASHRAMDGRLCRWDDATVYSDDGGKTWRSRTGINGVLKHPGMDYQCRCAAEANMLELYPDLAPEVSAPSAKPEEKKEVNPLTNKKVFKEKWEEVSTGIDSIATVADFKKIFEAMGYKITGNLDVVDIRALKDTAQSIKTHVRVIGPNFKDVIREIDFSAMPGRDSTYAAFAPARRRLWINPDYAGDYNRFMISVRRDADNGFHPRICLTVESVIDHEIGHGLSNDLNKAVMRRGKKVAEVAGKEFWNTAQKDLEKRVSKYATQSIEELVAESWGAYLRKKQYSAIVKNIGDSIMEAWR